MPTPTLRALVALAAAPLALIIVALPALAASNPFQPGAWEHHTKMVSADVPGVSEGLIKLVAGGGERKSCHPAAELKAHPESLMTADDKAVCKLRKLSLTGGKVVFDTFCTNDRFPDGLLVSSRGSYTPTSYTIRTTSTGKRDGKPVRIVTTGSGERTAPSCAKP